MKEKITTNDINKRASTGESSWIFMQHHHHLVFSLKFLTVSLRSSPSHFNYWSKTGGHPANEQEYCGFHRRFSDEFSSERKPVAVLLLPAVTETTEGWVSQVLKLREAQLIQQLINSSLSRHLNTYNTEKETNERTFIKVQDCASFRLRSFCVTWPVQSVFWLRNL